MKVGVLGSGGREHALCYALKNSDRIDKIYCFPGNAGTSLIATNIDINFKDFENSQTIENITLKLNQSLEKMIIKNPNQWIWSHNRWK